MSTDAYQSLYQVSQLFNSILDPELLLDRVIDEAIRIMNAERGLLVLVNEKTGGMDVKAARHLERALEKELSELSQTALREVLTTREGKIFIDAPGAFPGAQSIIIRQVRSIACVPLIARARLIGAIYLDSRTNRNVFPEDALLFLKALANIAALAIENAQFHQTLVTESSQLRAVLGEWQQFPEIVGKSAVMRQVYALMNRLLPADVPVLILGETGTGKELVARAIHYNGRRAKGPFVPVNCGAIPENLLESELFGYHKGAFSGATADKKGLLEAGDGGTIFLDEISDLPLALQAKILRVLQSGEVRRLGETDTFHVDVRVISATNQNLLNLTRTGKFREDLYYRLNVIPVELPPLRARRDDIPLLVNCFLKRSSERLGKKIAGISAKALARLIEHSWPGNIRELENVIERAVVLCPGSKITPEDIMIVQPDAPGLRPNAPKAEFEKQIVLERLKQFNGNRTRAAASLGISRRTLQNKLAEWKQEVQSSSAQKLKRGTEGTTDPERTE
jgi:Nif-specific regulatory protein